MEVELFFKNMEHHGGDKLKMYLLKGGNHEGRAVEKVISGSYSL